MTDAPPPDGGLRPSGTDAEKLRSVYYFHQEGLAVIRPRQRTLSKWSVCLFEKADANHDRTKCKKHPEQHNTYRYSTM